MIIVSQNKRSIHNLENINYIFIKGYEYSEIRCINNVYDANYTGGRILGSYLTEERAMEVLQEIIEQYKKICNDSYFLVYEMPEK